MVHFVVSYSTLRLIAKVKLGLFLDNSDVQGTSPGSVCS